jgi:hypothetical protein
MASWIFMQMDEMAGFGHRVCGEANDLDASIDNEFVAALTSGGDSRLTVDRRTGANKYLCPPMPAAGLICASCCTASPIATPGFQRARAFYASLAATASPSQRAQQLQQCSLDLAPRLLGYFGVADIAEATLCPSGTDALRIAATRLAAERPAEPITAILPIAAETGAGVPLAVAGREFDGVSASSPPPPGCMVRTVEIPLRSADGAPRSDDELVAAYTAAAAGVPGRPIVYLTHSTKTGLIAPVAPPPGADVIVDACQARIAPRTVAQYLRNGWPVVVTGSKFFGGPPFSGAVLFPAARRHPAHRGAPGADPVSLGTVLRWMAALDAIEAFSPLAARMPALLRDRTASIQQGLARNPALKAIGGLAPAGPDWSDLPSIFTFAVRDPMRQQRLLTAAELRPLYERLASLGILLGQPVGLGRFGGLRIAVGARDLFADAPADGGLPRVFAALEDLTAS